MDNILKTFDNYINNSIFDTEEFQNSLNEKQLKQVFMLCVSCFCYGVSIGQYETLDKKWN